MFVILSAEGPAEGMTGTAFVFKSKKRGSWSALNRLTKALYGLNFLNRDDTGQTACERQYSFDTKAHPRPPMMVKDLYTGEQKGPLDLQTCSRDYACVSTGHQVKWIPSFHPTVCSLLLHHPDSRCI